MFDKKAYNQEMEAVRHAQINEISDYLADYLRLNADIRTLKINPGAPEEILEKFANMPIPREGRAMKEVAEELVKDVFERSMLLQHPRFFSFVASAVSPYSLAGAVLSDIYNLNGCGWDLAPAACAIEERLIRWLGSLAGYDESRCGGLFTSGGSLSNLTAMMAARNTRLSEEEYPLGTAYMSDQAHSSLRKGLHLIGLRKDQIVILPSDENYKLCPEALEQAIVRDRAAGKKPFLVIGTLGTTNTGTIDPLEAIGRISEKYGLWFHVDGAYGGSVLISDIYRNLARGIECSDSLSWDTHKWAMQIYSCSALIARDKKALLDTFTEHPEYLADVISAEHNDPWDLGPEMSRPHRAIKLWFTLQAMGTDKLADVIDYSFYNAKLAERELRAREGWEILSAPMCGAINFRFVPEGMTDGELDELNGEISRRIDADGFAYIVTTTLKGKRVLRLCLINANTDEDDVIDTIDYLDRIARDITAQKAE